jgi:hypothetical protein
VDLRRQIHGVLGWLPSLFWFLWLEQSWGRSDAVSFKNKLVAVALRRLQVRYEVEVLPSGRGGKGECRNGVARCAALLLPAGLGGEGKLRCCTASLLLLWRLVFWRCSLWRNSVLLGFLACRGGEEKDQGAAVSVYSDLRCCLPTWCYGAAATRSSTPSWWRPSWRVHPQRTYAGVIAQPLHLMADWRLSSRSVIINLQRGGLALSFVPDRLSLLHQVVRPRWSGDGRRWKLCLGGEDRGWDCFLCITFEVLFVNCQGHVVFFTCYQGLACKSIPPMVI